MPTYPIPPDAEEKGLGDLMEKALTTVGLTKDRVESWLGEPCGCKERKEKLNQISAWAKRILRGKVDHAREFLNGILGRN